MMNVLRYFIGNFLIKDLLKTA